MAVTLGNNIAALVAQRRIGDSVLKGSRISERLASGLRINRASDDAAGLAIADSLRVDQRLQSQAIRNANDGLSMLSIASGAVGELSNIVIRIAEIAEQAANGTYSDTQRQKLNKEAVALQSEYNRIVASTEFNGVKLLNGSVQSVDLQVGVNSSSSATLNVTSGAFITGLTWDGTFTAAQTASITGLPDTVTAPADLNGDGYTDIVATGSSNLNIAFGNGDGTFGAFSALGVGTDPAQVYDFDRDGDVDIIAREGPSMTMW